MCGALAAPLSSLQANNSPEGFVSGSYTVSATILLFGLPLFRKSKVGAGTISCRQTPDQYTFEFAAGSLPEEAAGLNRLGFIREQAPATEDGDNAATLFGFMTASKEESFDQARKALEKREGLQPYSVMEGHVDGTGARSKTAEIALPASLRWPAVTDLEKQLRAAFPAAPKRDFDVPTPQSGRPKTFLAALYGAMRQGAGTGSARYIWNGKLYRMDWKTQPDQTLLRLEGSLRGDGTANKRTPFRLWFDPRDKQPLPVKIDYQPRSFIRLVFEKAGLPEGATS